MELSPLFTWRGAVTSPESGLPPNTRYVALALSLHMNERGTSCFPSIARQCSETGLSKNTVLDALRRLEQTGWLDVERVSRPGRGDVNRYSATIPAPIAERVQKGFKSRAQKGSTTEPEDVKEDVYRKGFNSSTLSGPVYRPQTMTDKEIEELLKKTVLTDEG